ncbi:DoxX family protein [Corynebacterium uterequi]|uniref:DoxX protein n=1 Tax=Corynebacterium uterequi TaxID=1072256 RepID=A0A0G3HE38_9CORY|nr:DoxX family protein [Corynebacterium uterequi]AKK11000.1 DoxX protein [Corynebacterium uterequi]
MIRTIARPMLASVYIADGVDTLINTDAHKDSAESAIKAARKVIPAAYASYIPASPALAARVVGGTKVGAGSLLALGKAPRLSAGLLVLTAIPTIVGRHAFWDAEDSEERTARRQGFLTDIALLGGLGITTMDTAGKPGLRWRAGRAAKDASQAVQAALPTQSQTETAMSQASEWLSEKAEQTQEAAKKASAQVAEYVDENKDDWKDKAQAVAATAAVTAGALVEQGKDAAQKAADNAPQWAEQARKQGETLLKQGEGFVEQAKSEAKVARTRAAKAAEKAQKRARAAAADAEKKSGRAGKRAQKQASKLQDRAAKLVDKAAANIK